MSITQKYIKPRSMTWWASLVPLLSGLTVATLPLHGNAALVEAINNASGDMSAAMLINIGVAGIGLRGALG